MSEKSDWYKRTYGMSFYDFCLISKSKEPFILDAKKKIVEGIYDDWFLSTKASDIVGEKAVKKLIEEEHIC